MDYADRLSEIFGPGKGPTSLRAIFDCESTQWTMMKTEKKVFFLEKMIASGYPLESWIEDYKEEYKKTHPHIMKAIDKSLLAIKTNMENSYAKNQIEVYLDETDLREIKGISTEFLFNAYFDLKEGVDVACIKRAYRDLNRTLINFHVVKEDGKRAAQKIESLRKVVRSEWQEFLIKIISELRTIDFNNNPQFDDWHSKVCNDLMNTSSHKLTFGQSQKWINMTVKYLVVFGELNILKNIKYFHIPIDSLIMQALEKNKMFNIKKIITPWSKIEDQKIYLEYQKKFREIVSPKAPLKVEFDLFNKILLSDAN